MCKEQTSPAGRIGGTHRHRMAAAASKKAATLLTTEAEDDHAPHARVPETP